MTFDITLPANKVVVFPPRCVVCEAKNPNGLIKLSFLGAETTPLLGVAADELLDLDVDPKYYSSNTINKIEGIPACKGCASSLKWYHRLLKVGYYTAWIPGLILLLLLPGPVIIKTIIMIAFAISPGILTLIFPPSFGASFFNGKANFEFKSKTVAEEFLKLNSDAELKSNKTDIKTNPAQAG